MKKEFTVGNALSIFIPVLLIIIAWGNSIEVQVNKQDVRIEIIEKTNGKVEKKLDVIQLTMTNILVELQNKKNRD